MKSCENNLVHPPFLRAFEGYYICLKVTYSLGDLSMTNKQNKTLKKYTHFNTLNVFDEIIKTNFDIKYLQFKYTFFDCHKALNKKIAYF